MFFIAYKAFLTVLYRIQYSTVATVFSFSSLRCSSFVVAASVKIPFYSTVQYHGLLYCRVQYCTRGRVPGYPGTVQYPGTRTYCTVLYSTVDCTVGDVKLCFASRQIVYLTLKTIGIHPTRVPYSVSCPRWRFSIQNVWGTRSQYFSVVNSCRNVPPCGVWRSLLPPPRFRAAHTVPRDGTMCPHNPPRLFHAPCTALPRWTLVLDK